MVGLRATRLHFVKGGRASPLYKVEQGLDTIFTLLSVALNIVPGKHTLLTGLHSDGPIQSYGFSVEHAVFNNMPDKQGKFVRMSQSFREGNRLS